MHPGMLVAKECYIDAAAVRRRLDPCMTKRPSVLICIEKGTKTSFCKFPKCSNSVRRIDLEYIERAAEDLSLH